MIPAAAGRSQRNGGAAELLQRAQEADDEEDRRYGRDKGGDELPEELSFRDGRLEKIREAVAALEAKAQAEAKGGNHPGVPEDKGRLPGPVLYTT